VIEERFPVEKAEHGLGVAHVESEDHGVVIVGWLVMRTGRRSHVKGAPTGRSPSG
jgi:hypothetical protein